MSRPELTETPTVKFLSQILGCMELDSWGRNVVKALSVLLCAAACQVSLRELRRPWKCWRIGSSPTGARTRRPARSSELVAPVCVRRLGQSMWGELFLPGRCEALVELWRSEGQARFSEEDEVMLSFALGNALKVLDRAERYQSTRRITQLFAAVLDQVDAPCVFTDPQGTVVFRNRAAVAPLARGELNGVLAETVGRLREAAESAESSTLLPPVAQSETDEWQSKVLLLPDGALAGVLAGLRGAGVPELTARGSITEREQQVADLVAQGLTNEEIAGVLLISVNTVKRHLKQAYRRLNVSTRAELVARLMNAPKAGRVR